MTTITDADIKRALQWLERMEIAARMKHQTQNKQEAAHVAKVIRQLTGR